MDFRRKALIKRVFKSGLYKISSYIYKNTASKVIFYHDIHALKAFTDMSTPIELFKKHISVLQEEGYTIVPEIQNPEEELLITFDDGFRGLYENFSFFIERKIPVKIFLIVDFIGQDNYLRKEEIKEMLNSGLLSIGSHTCSHPNLDTLASEEIHSELHDSKVLLEEMFDQNISEICYPRGKFSDDVIFVAKKVGYKTQYSCLPGALNTPFRRGVVNRSLVQNASPSEFKSILKGADKMFFKRYLRQQYTSE